MPDTSWLYLSIYMAMPKNLSDKEIQDLLADRKSGMGLQKAAKKYGIGIPKLQRIEKQENTETSTEVVPAASFAMPPQTLSAADIQKHFQEVQDSFSMVLGELEAIRLELQTKIIDPIDIEDLEEEMLDELEDLEEKVGWQLQNSNLFGVFGVAVALLAMFARTRAAAPKQYYKPPSHEETPPPSPPPKKKTKIPEME